MSATQHPRMTADEFIAWATKQPKGGRYELEDGEVVTDMAPERAFHAQTKFEITHRLRLAIDASGLPCMVMPDGMGVRVDATTVYEPDALVRCGAKIARGDAAVPDPVVVVEVVSPSTANRDQGVKFADYLRVASLHHYLLVLPERLTVIHHHKQENGRVLTRIIRDGVVRLDPPGVTLENFWPEGLTE